MTRNNPALLMEQLLHRVEGIQSDVWRLNMEHWEWNSGVCLFGIIKAYEATHQEQYLRFLREWYDRNAPRRKSGSVNTVISANVALLLLQETGDRQYEEVCEEYVDWCLRTALKTSNGGFAHVWSEGGLEDYKNQLWIDSLFMACLFMLRYGAYKGNEELLRAAREQFDIHIRCQFDQEAELFYHGYHCVSGKPLGEFWGRGNGWAAASLVELLEHELASQVDNSPYTQVFRRLMERAYGLRLPDGTLRTLLVVEDAYSESTATELFAYAALKGARLGVLDERFEAWGRETAEALSAQLSQNIIPQRASGGTDCQGREGYLQVPYTETLYAYGIPLMLLSESLLPGGKLQETAHV
ncbi:glycoside hydrolase family 88 protein [Paenibacillus sp. PL2-23]|uniref:glycoside hydrolase family 88 protein n=1 Tax=Paenibacillus sp. PL2-23 TaxID=2100729 RepID=UPI0030F63B09